MKFSNIYWLVIAALGFSQSVSAYECVAQKPQSLCEHIAFHSSCVKQPSAYPEVLIEKVRSAEGKTFMVQSGGCAHYSRTVSFVTIDPVFSQGMDTKILWQETIKHLEKHGLTALFGAEHIAKLKAEGHDDTTYAQIDGYQHFYISIAPKGDNAFEITFIDDIAL